MSKEALIEIRNDFWHEAFKNGAQCGVMIDGLYDICVARDWVMMFCGGAV
jgi:hypothetical protein